MIGIFTAILGAVGWIGGNLHEQSQNDKARIYSMRNPNNPTGTYMDFRGQMRDCKTDQPVILSGDGKGNIRVQDIYGITMRVCNTNHTETNGVNKKEFSNYVPYNMRNAKKYTRPRYCDSWQCKECGAWNYLDLDKKCRGCGKEKAESDHVHHP